MTKKQSSVGRRNFIRDSGLMIAGGAITGAVAAGKSVHAGGSGRVRIGIVGCGRRGRFLIDQLLSVGGPSVEIVAMGDYFPDQVQSMYRRLKGRFQEQFSDQCIRSGGLQACQAVMQSDADLVYLAAPPFARPDHFRAAVDAGKPVFMEKPLAADFQGLRQIVQTAALAKKNGLSVHVGFQRRHDERYRDVVRQIEEGRIGEVLFARAFCNAGALRRLSGVRPTPDSQADFEYQVRNWNHFQWTGGDFLIEQHVAGLDVIRWALGKNPIVAQGQGGWGLYDRANVHDLGNADAPSPQEHLGQVFDHHSVEFEFANGVHLMSQCRRVAKAWNNTSEHLHGTLGRADLSSAKIVSNAGKVLWQSSHPRCPDVGSVAQAELVLRTLRQGEVVSEIDSAVQSTLWAMLGHEATRGGKRVRMEKVVRSVS